MRVFVYGTLTDPAVARQVLEAPVYAGTATLVGLDRAAGEYPTLVPPGTPAATGETPTVDGRLLRVDDAGLAALDAYERVPDGLYVRVSVPVAPGGPGADAGAGAPGEGASPGRASVETYVGAPDRLGVPADWPGDGPLAERVSRYVEAHGVRVRPA